MLQSYLVYFIQWNVKWTMLNCITLPTSLGDQLIPLSCCLLGHPRGASRRILPLYYDMSAYTRWHNLPFDVNMHNDFNIVRILYMYVLAWFMSIARHAMYAPLCYRYQCNGNDYSSTCAFIYQMSTYLAWISYCSVNGSVRDENNVLQLWPAVTLVEQLRMPCGVCKSNDLNDTLLTVNAKCCTLSWFLH